MAKKKKAAKRKTGKKRTGRTKAKKAPRRDKLTVTHSVIGKPKAMPKKRKKTTARTHLQKAKKALQAEMGDLFIRKENTRLKRDKKKIQKQISAKRAMVNKLK